MNGATATRRGGLTAPERNRFFHGKMMDVHQFQLETAYGIGMRRLLNRLVIGSGVVCGLDVVAGDADCAIEVTSGVAIDRWGREIVVPTRTTPIPIPRALLDRVCGPPEESDYPAGAGSGGGSDQAPEDEVWVTVLLCYHECETEPVAVLAGECSTSTPCAPGAIREQYRIVFEPGRAHPIELSCRFPDVLARGELDYAALATWITRECPAPPRNPCIPLANLRLDCRQDGCAIEHVDITVRPIVFGNDVLVDMLTRIVEDERSDEDYRR